MPIFDIGKTARELVNAFQLDCLIPIARSEEIDAFLDSFPHLVPPFTRYSIIDTISSEYRELDSLYSLASRSVRDLAGHMKNKTVRLVSWEDDDTLDLILLSIFGDGFASLYEDFCEFESIEIAASQDVPDLTVGEVLVPEFTLGVVIRPTRDKMRKSRIIYAFSEPSLDVAIDYWNLRASGASIIPLFVSDDKRLVAHEEKAKAAATGKFRMFAGGKASLICSSNLVEELPKDFTELRELTVEEFVLKNDSLCYFDHSESIGVTAVEERGIPTCFIEIPKGPFTTDLPRNEPTEPIALSLMVSIFPTSDFDATSEFTLLCPPVTALNGVVTDHITMKSTNVPSYGRVTKEGISFYACEYDRFLEIQAFNRKAILTRTIVASGFDVTYSDAGARCNQMIRRMGGVEECKVFRDQSIRDLLLEFKRSRWLSEGTVIQKLSSYLPKAPEFSRKEEKKRIASENWDIAKEKVDYLVKKGVLQLTIHQRCPYCHIPHALPADLVRSNVQCPSCGDYYSFYSQHEDWGFKRTELFNPEDDQGGGVSVSLALGQLLDCKGWWSKPLFQFGMQFTDEKWGLQNEEVDIVLFHLGEREMEVVIGECKSQDFPDANDIFKLSFIAQQLQASLKCPVYVLLAGFGKVSFDILNEIAELSSEQRYIVLARGDLDNPTLPGSVIERTKWSVSSIRQLWKYSDDEIARKVVILNLLDKALQAKSNDDSN